MSGVNNNNPFLHLNSRRLIQSTPTNKIIEEALNVSGDTPSSPSSTSEVDSDLISLQELDQHLLLGMRNIKIVTTAESTPEKTSAVKADSTQSASGTGVNGGSGTSGTSSTTSWNDTTEVDQADDTTSVSSAGGVADSENTNANGVNNDSPSVLEGFDDEMINIIVESLKDTIPNIDSQTVKTMINDITKMAESKDVNASDYVSARLVDFLTMRAENPELTLDEMNEQLALSQISNNTIEGISSIYSNVFGEEIESLDDLLELQVFALWGMNEEPSLRSAYMNTREYLYMQLAQNDELTNGEYYELLKNDLVNIFSSSSNMAEEEIEELFSKVDKLDLNQIKELINQAITLPAADDENYSSALSSFISEFNSTVNNSNFNGVQNPDGKMRLNEVYKDIVGVDFDADGIINAFDKLNEAESIMNATSVQLAVENIQEKVESGDLSYGEALWQMAYLSSGSAEDEDILEFIKTITENDNVQIEGASVIFDTTVAAPTMTRGGGGMRRSGTEPQDVKAFNNVIEYYNNSYQAQTGCTNTAEADSKVAEMLSNPDFYKSLGNYGEAIAGGIFLGGSAVSAGLLATGPIGGVGAAAAFGFTCVASDIAMKGAVVANTIGDTLEFIQNVKRDGVTAENVTSYAWEMAKNAGEFALTTAKVGNMIAKTAWKGIEKLASTSVVKTLSSIVQKTLTSITNRYLNIENILIRNPKLASYYDKVGINDLKTNKKIDFADFDGKCTHSGYWDYSTAISKIQDNSYYGDLLWNTNDIATKKMLNAFDKFVSESNPQSFNQKIDVLDKFIYDLTKGQHYDKAFNYPLGTTFGRAFGFDESRAYSAITTVCRHRAALGLILAERIGIKGETALGLGHAWLELFDDTGRIHIRDYQNYSSTMGRLADNFLDEVNKAKNMYFGRYSTYQELVENNFKYEPYYSTQTIVNSIKLEKIFQDSFIAASISALAFGFPAANAQNPTQPKQPDQPKEPEQTKQPEQPEPTILPDLPNPPVNNNDNSNGANNDDDNDGRQGHSDNSTPDVMPNKPPQDTPNSSGDTQNTPGNEPNNNGNNGNNGDNGDNRNNGNGDKDGNGDNNGSQNGNNQPSDGMSWGPGHPDYDALYGDLDGNAINGSDFANSTGGQTQTQTQTITIDQNQLNNMFPDIGNSTIAANGDNVTSILDVSGSDAAIIIQDRLNNTNDGWQYDVQYNSDGTYTITRTRTTETGGQYGGDLSDSDLNEIEAWLNSIANDDSRDLASLDGAPGPAGDNSDEDKTGLKPQIIGITYPTNGTIDAQIIEDNYQTENHMKDIVDLASELVKTGFFKDNESAINALSIVLGDNNSNENISNVVEKIRAMMNGGAVFYATNEEPVQVITDSNGYINVYADGGYAYYNNNDVLAYLHDPNATVPIMFNINAYIGENGIVNIDALINDWSSKCHLQIISSNDSYEDITKALTSMGVIAPSSNTTNNNNNNYNSSTPTINISSNGITPDMGNHINNINDQLLGVGSYSNLNSVEEAFWAQYNLTGGIYIPGYGGIYSAEDLYWYQYQQAQQMSRSGGGSNGPQQTSYEGLELKEITGYEPDTTAEEDRLTKFLRSMLKLSGLNYKTPIPF